ncbi:LON peptidase substrate-binding domain-containing protein [Polynucleobacter sp. MG-27-Goln-C1]|uniref:LON peptidase substrate-binding domain-containing protein n=1 Tax=Polynucleobacter sp. MG-27-Goln-C1 TaxID=1819726 RepID=UPI001C0B17B7|nr:LON peptidase substrate-binding domain-containing protein [Polynucleobacter sp. MG-27-Goln-C1]MBU3611399.1 LON peptidase substrate-binding domain-containing protein [Polynucleobacter sp. MG-27-Goln-C1]
MTKPSATANWIPLFPLGTTLFPGGVIALKIFEARYLDMMKRCLRENSPFGVVSILENNPLDSDADALANFSNIGTLAKLEEFDPIQPALYMTKSYGTQRFHLLHIKQESDGLWMGQVELIDADPEIPLPKEHEKVAAILQEIIAIIKTEDLLGEDAFKIPENLDDCGWVSNRLAELLPLPLAQKNHLLAQSNPRIRLDLISEIIEDDGLRNIVIH